MNAFVYKQKFKCEDLSVATQIFDKGFIYSNSISSLVTIILKFCLSTASSLHSLGSLALEISDTFNFAFTLPFDLSSKIL